MAKLSMDGFLRSVKLIPSRDDDHYDDYDDYDEDEPLDDEDEPAPRKSIRTSASGRKTSSVRREDPEDDYDLEDEDEGGSSYYSAPARSRQAVAKAVGAVSGTAQRGASSGRGKKEEAPTDVNVRILHPKTIEDANSIADELVSEKIVVMNLEEVDMAAAQRIVDFVSGACYSVDGNLQKIAKKAFIVTPKNAILSSELGSIIREAVGLSSVNIMK